MNDLTEYLNGAVERLIRQALKSSLHNPRESAFITKFLFLQKKASKKRRIMENDGLHIPPFLIASIASQCNLHCKGCYARANHACGESAKQDELPASKWEQIFREAAQLGITFILLAGGEPLLRRDVIETAAHFRNIIFPVFTNGTMLSEKYQALFCENRNLVPVLSLEGDSARTDDRRGKGVAALIGSAKTKMKANGVFYGVSITVTAENIDIVTDENFISSLDGDGCGLVLFVEYVPAQESTENLALTDEQRKRLVLRQSDLKEKFKDMVFLSFPGDEKAVGGCLAAGRGFFHINAVGGAEPCPFSPYSDVNLKNSSLVEALRSPLFKTLDDYGFLQGEHKGGCVLFDKRDDIKKLMGAEK